MNPLDQCCNFKDHKFTAQLALTSDTLSLAAKIPGVVVVTLSGITSHLPQAGGLIFDGIKIPLIESGFEILCTAWQ